MKFSPKSSFSVNPLCGRLWSSSVFVLLGIAVGVLVITDGIEGHSVKNGACPTEVEVQHNFDLDKFLGVWYVIQKTSTSSSCMKLNITRTQDGVIKIYEFSRTFPLQMIRVDHTTIYAGELNVPDPTEPARMEVRYNLSPLGTVPFWIVETNYSEYASTWSCGRMLWGHFQDAMILSRKPRLDNEVAKKLRTKFNGFGIDPGTLSFIDQKPCTGMMEDKSGDKTFSLGPVHINLGNKGN